MFPIRRIAPRRRSIAIACVVAALSLSFAPPAFADQPHDAWITTKVKMKLIAARDLDALAIDVDTSDGYVTLHGSVGSEAEQQRAEELARQIEGVHEVRSLIAVVPEAAEENVGASDEEIRQRVENVLARDAALEGSDIAIDSVNDGIVVLEGEASTLSAHRRALENARSVDGVRSVASRIRSPNELADREIWRDGGSKGSSASEALARAAADTWITSQAKARLLVEPGLSPLAVNVDTRRGVVTLFGRVASDAVKETAGREVGKISGVKGIENELQVVPDVAASNVDRDDAQLEDTVRGRLDQYDALRESDIEIEVAAGVVRLTGSVDSHGDKMRALTVARRTEGVSSVVDGLRVQAGDRS